MDLTAFEAIGLSIPVLVGRDTVVLALMKSVGETQDSTHQITNFIMQGTSSGEVDVECYALVQHYRRGVGLAKQEKDYYLMGNRYKALVSHGGDGWRMKKMTVRAQWVQGDVEVMKAH